ncbi:hypothetical protein [Variovorax sp. J31P207]|nr:hypothetical protein [Variovorax sp. J31P207]MDM0071671.1 hypothetical protein [Variovorax sp. J31P207]
MIAPTETSDALAIAFGFLAVTLWISWLIRHSRFGFYLRRAYLEH